MIITGKFIVQTVTSAVNSQSVRLIAVEDASNNYSQSKTPQAGIILTIDLPAALGALSPGQILTLTLQP